GERGQVRILEGIAVWHHLGARSLADPERQRSLAILGAPERGFDLGADLRVVDDLLLRTIRDLELLRDVGASEVHQLPLDVLVVQYLHLDVAGFRDLQQVLLHGGPKDVEFLARGAVERGINDPHFGGDGLVLVWRRWPWRRRDDEVRDQRRKNRHAQRDRPAR